MELSEYTMEKLRIARETHEKWKTYFEAKHGKAACSLDDDAIIGFALGRLTDELEYLMHERR